MSSPAFFKPAQAATTAVSEDWDSYKSQNISKIYSYTDEFKKTSYFYFFKGKRSEHYPINELKNLREVFEKHEEELIQEYNQLKRV